MVMDGEQSKARDSVALELRRGALVLAVLSQLKEEQYGYSLKKLLSAGGIEIEEGTLYPLLRRLEATELLESEWRLGDGRPRRYYRISARGRVVLEELTEDWKSLSRALGRLLK